MPLLLSPFQALIKARTGLMLEDANSQDKLRSAVAESMASEGVSTPESYLAKITEHQSSFQALVNRLTINETYFFREAEQIHFLVNHLIPSMRQKAPSRVLRILSAGCSTGEEPYSIVMALIEAYGESALDAFKVMGADIDSQALLKAKKAHYSEFSFRGVSLERRHRFFDRIGAGFDVKPVVRDQVSFHEFNLFAPNALPELADFDVIFFRNVSIYFDTATRKVIQQNLAQRLSEQGVLMIGTAETLANDLGVLTLIEQAGIFYFTHSAPLVSALPKSVSAKKQGAASASTPTIIPEPLRPLITHGHKQQIIDCVQQKRYDQALPLFEALNHDYEVDLQLVLLRAFVFMNRKQWAQAESLLLKGLSLDDWCLDTLILLGLLAKWQQQTLVAIEWFKKAVYAHSDSWLAHYYLADTYRAEQPALALRAYRSALELMDQHPECSGLQWVPLDFSLAELRFLSQHQLLKLSSLVQGAS